MAPAYSATASCSQADRRRSRDVGGIEVATFGGQEKTWDAEITEQIPDERIAWRARSGAANAGVVTFHRIGDGPHASGSSSSTSRRA